MRAVILTEPRRLVPFTRSSTGDGAQGSCWLRGVRVNGASPTVGEAVVVLLGEQRLLGKVAQVYFRGGLFYDVRCDQPIAPLSPTATSPRISAARSIQGEGKGGGVEQGRLV